MPRMTTLLEKQLDEERLEAAEVEESAAIDSGFWGA
jgi:hypothetical protein